MPICCCVIDCQHSTLNRLFDCLFSWYDVILADLCGQFGPTKLVLQCPGSEVSWVQSVRNSVL